MFLGGLCMNKRNFLRKGASLVGSGALLGSTFMPGSSAGAVNYDEMYQSMLNESWKYFFARMLAAIGIVFWRNKLKKETYEAVPQRLRDNIKKLIDENFESEPTIYTDDKGNKVDCYSCRFLNEGVNLCLEKGREDVDGIPAEIFRLCAYYFDKEGNRKIDFEIYKTEVAVDAETVGKFFDQHYKIFENLDLIVTIAKLKNLFKKYKDLFEQEESDFFNFKKDFYIEGKKVKGVGFNGDTVGDLILRLEGNKKALIVGEDGEEDIDYFSCRPKEKMTQYMKEILKQAEKKYGAKVLKTESKELNKINKNNNIVVETYYDYVKENDDSE